MESIKYDYKNKVPHLIFVLFSLVCIVPFFYILAISLTGEMEVAADGYKLFPNELDLDSYKFVLKYPKQILNAYKVSVFVTVVGTFFGILLTSMLAYVISRKDFVLSKFLTFAIFFTLIFNVGLVPWYMLIVRYYHLKNNILVLILPYLVLPWHVFLLKGFMQEFPFSLIEAAKIDGSSEIRTFFTIVLPMSKSALATVGLFCAFRYWNDWWLSMLYIEKSELIPLQYMLYRIMMNAEALSRYASNVTIGEVIPAETARMALCILAVVPMLVVFPFFQKYFVKGLTVGAVKG